MLHWNVGRQAKAKFFRFFPLYLRIRKRNSLYTLYKHIFDQDTENLVEHFVDYLQTYFKIISPF